MKILMLSTRDISSGAARAAYRIHQAIRQVGINSKMLVIKKSSSDQTVLTLGFHSNIFVRKIRQQLDEIPKLAYLQSKQHPFSVSWLPGDALKYVKRINPDIVHLQWICNGFISIKELPKIKKPIIWTLHDSWPFTGGCHLPYNCLKYQNKCGSCPQLGSDKIEDLSRRIWEKKRKYWRHLNLTIVTPSNWLTQCARESSLFYGKKIVTIPNGIDIDSYRPVDKKIARKKLNLTPNKYYILFGAIDFVKDKNKGWHYLKQSLNIISNGPLAKKVELIYFGSSDDGHFDPALKSHYLGKIHSEAELNHIYSAADVTVVASKIENLPNIITESLACGTPCVAFKVGGIVDMIDHQQNGYLATPFKPEELARGIKWIIDNNQDQALSLVARKKAKENFDITKTASKYKELYNEVLSQSLSR